MAVTPDTVDETPDTGFGTSPPDEPIANPSPDCDALILPDGTPASVESSPAIPKPDPIKVQFRFRKDGALRWLSHHDLMRTLERTLRRSELPMRTTQGFHPHPRMVFALAMPLGVIGCEEVVELELDVPSPEEEILNTLKPHCPPGFTLLSVRKVPFRKTAQVRRLSYRLPIPADRIAATEEKIREILGAEQVLVERKRTPGRKNDIRPFISEIEIQNGQLTMTFWMKPAGTARPDEMLELLGLADLPGMGVVLERSRLELHEEQEPVPVDEVKLNPEQEVQAD